MPRLSNAMSYGPAEALYAAADSLVRTLPGSTRASLLQDKIMQFIREDHLRALLHSEDVHIHWQGDDTVTLKLHDDLPAEQRVKTLERLTNAIREVIA